MPAGYCPRRSGQGGSASWAALAPHEECPVPCGPMEACRCAHPAKVAADHSRRSQLVFAQHLAVVGVLGLAAEAAVAAVRAVDERPGQHRLEDPLQLVQAPIEVADALPLRVDLASRIMPAGRRDGRRQQIAP